MTNFSSRRIVSFLFIVGIAVVFTLQFGPGSRGCEAPISSAPANAVAVVNGQEIPLLEFRRAYRNTLSMYRNQGLSEAMARQLGLHRQVLDQLVTTELLAQAAEKHGIAPSDDELAELIHQNADFQKNGQFDPVQYRSVLRDWYRKTDVEFERELRRQLAAQKMWDTVANSAAVSEDEVRARFQKEGNRAEVTFVRFTPAMFAAKVGKPTAQDLAAFKQAQRPQIEEYYQQNRFLYHQPEQVRARHILIKVPEDATDAQREEARQKVENLRQELSAGKDFAELASAFSEDEGSRGQGGDLGFNPADAWVKPFSDAAFSLKPGEVSDPVESQFGIHLIKVEEKRAPQSRELALVEDEIATSLWAREQAKVLAKQQAQQALEAARAGRPLAQQFPPGDDEPRGQLGFEQPPSPQSVATGEFNAATEAMPRLGVAPKVLVDVFAREAPGLLDQVYEVGDAQVVVEVGSRTRPEDEAFTGKREALFAEARQAKQFELRDSFLKTLREQGTVVTNDQAIEEVLGPAGDS